MQEADPVVGLNFPASQLAHALPSYPVCPGMQVHAEMAALASGELEFVGQDSQALLRSNVRGKHAVHS